MNDFQYVCDKCPRTFKLQEFYDKHKKVHQLKKQHKCNICGFVYGAAKGLEGHLKTHEEEKVPFNEEKTSEPPYNVDYHFLNPRGVLAQANIPMPVKEDDEKDLSLKIGKSPTISGTGTYEVYDSVPEISDATAAAQNESGFFMCNICKREFSGLNSLKKHIPIHTRRVQHRCDVCGFVFGKKEYLLDHMRKHTGEVSPVCEVCGQTFNKSLKLKEHFKSHRNPNPATSGINPYQCHICKGIFGRAAMLGSHLATAHAETVYKCDICEATFGDVRGKNHHMYNEHQLDAFHQKCVWCPVCNQGFTRHYNLKVHMYKSHGKDYIENNFSAAELAALTKPPPGTSTSGTAKSKGSDGPSKSPLSGKSTVPGKHYFDVKNGTQVFACQMCSEKFVRKSDLYIHLDSDHGVILIGCTLCDDKFLDMLQLQDHVHTVHQPKPVKRKPGPASKTNAPPESRGSTWVECFKCTECGNIFQDSNSLESHKNLVHGKLSEIETKPPQVEEDSDEEDLNSPLAMIIKNLTEAAARKANRNVAESCNFCDKVFESQTDLKDHIINIHIRGFYFSCELCGKSFPHQEGLNSHTRTKHPNLAKRTQQLKSALGLEPDNGPPPAKRSRVEGQYDQQPAVSRPGPLSAKLKWQAKQAQARPAETEIPEEEYRFEPITEAFIFEDQIIHPCYVVLPYSTEEDIKKACNFNKNVASTEYDFDEEVPLTIDESAAVEDEEKEIQTPEFSPAKVPALAYNAEDLNLNMSPSQGFYPALPDFSLPFTMANLWKKKADILGPVAAMQQVELMEKIEQMQKYNGSPMVYPPSPPPLAIVPQTQISPNNNNNSGYSPKNNGTPGKKGKSKSSPQKINNGESNAQVSAYESQIQDDIWPVDCIKCNALIGSLDNFNIHMNDHWSEDKCCPVCGLLINSKRFNFKQHLKIHTGEKPFVCAICNRSFRQKAHMVKHVTTHRGVPNLAEIQAAAISAK